MPTYIKGNNVANATKYKLFKKASGQYTQLAEKNEINFEVSSLGLATGDHVLVVKATGDGYEDSEYSNEVTYTVVESGGNTGGETGGDEPTPTTTWYIDHATQLRNNGVDLTKGSGLGLTAGAFAYLDETNALLVGKPINTVQLSVHTAGKFTFYRVNKSASTMTEIQSFNLENPSTTLQTYTFTTPFTLASGEYLVFGNTTDTGKPHYYYSVDFKGSFNENVYYQVTATRMTKLPSLCNMNMNIGYVA
ncbi:hypothetical protein [Methanobrevibacter sp.]|uniref:hypothetical protein n=1 Tax=Methanobrevibacter sp. TaxID=66852 RepID=UPI00388E5F6A